MLGAIVGDIAGSTYENYNCKNNDKIRLFAAGSEVTDDSVLTIATADLCLQNKLEQEQGGVEVPPWEKFKACSYTQTYKNWANRYPKAGYGPTFRRWMFRPDPKPYQSWGNGSAMRVSPIAWIPNKDLEWVLLEAKSSAEVTHDHPEGIKGAQATAAAVYMARTGRSKQEIREYISNTFTYDLNRTIDEIRPTYDFEVSCQKSVPEAIIAFLESENFEDAIRLAISLGGDSDTIACITGAIAHAYYGSIPQWMVQYCRSVMEADQLEVVDHFCRRYHVPGSADTVGTT